MGSSVDDNRIETSDEPAETLYLTARTRVLKVRAGAGWMIHKQPLGPGAAERLRLEKAMLARLQGVPGILQPLQEDAPAHALVFADARGVALSRLLAARRLDTAEVLELGLGLARVLTEVHRRGIIHKDINPANVVVGEDPSQVFLIDFDLASTFAEERLAFSHLSELTGTLPFMAPEQTGRTGRLLDWRSDLYSLGATLYVAATGRPPFEGDDPLQLVHDHLARAPLPPDSIDARVPRDLSRIILRLLEKEPDARYQSADGLVFDLARAQQRLAAGDTSGFELGERDFPPRLRPPSRLRGRDTELATLRRTFDEVAHGACGMVLVSGAPGVGKSALLDEARAWVTPAGGLFAAGKFDAIQQDGEADGVRQALRAVLRLLLAEPEEQLATLRTSLRRALGVNASLAAAMLPELSHLLGVTADAALADTNHSRSSLQQITQLLLRTLAIPGRPVVLVIDDLQWAPRAALDMLDAVHLDEDMRGVLVLGSFRHNEVDASHPLHTLIGRWERLGFAPRRLHLENLPPPALAGMLGECLRLGEDDARALATAIRPLTGGNPFDTLELVDSLRRDGVLQLQPGGWQWDATRIHQHLEGRNVEALVARRLEGIPAVTLELLDSMACMGGMVPLTRLAAATGRDAGSLTELLAPALQEGLLIRDRSQEALQFRHDRVLQAVVSRLDATLRARLQRVIAQRLAAAPEHAGVAAEIYLQVASTLDDPAECAAVIALFRAAAAQSRLAVNWTQIERYAREALALLDRHPDLARSESCRDLRLPLLADHHAALYGLGRLAEADAVYERILDAATDPLHLAAPTWTQIASLTQRDRPRDAVALAMELLDDLGLAVPDTTKAMNAAIEQGLAELYAWQREETGVADPALPECRDPRALAIARTLNRSIPAGFYSDQQVMAWMIISAARLWREKGASAALIGPLSHSAFVTIAWRDDYRGGHDIVRRVLDVAAARNYELDGAQAHFTYALSAAHWLHPLEHGVAEARNAQEILLRAGELHFGHGAYYSVLKNLIDCAATVDELDAAASAAVDASRRVGNEQAAATFIAYRQLARSLRGATHALGSFTDDGFDENAHVAELADNPVGLVNFRLTRALAALIAGETDDFIAQMAAASPLLQYTEATYLRATGHLLDALALAHRARAAQPAERTRLLRELLHEREWMAARAADSPGTFQHQLLFIDAELAWLQDDFRHAAQHYDEAFRLASARRRPWQAALILEQAARCRDAHGMTMMRDLLLARARAEYSAWGAQAKCEAMGPALAEESPPLPGGSRRPGSHRSGSVRGREIDLLGMLKAAQQLQAETDPDRLLDAVTTVLSALSGATSVRLALWSEESRMWFADVKGEDGERRQVPFDRAVEQKLLPSTAFRYAQRTREPLVVDDVLMDERFRRDPYFAGLQRCSLLVVPVLSRGTLKAMLLLENRRAQAMFSAHRLDGVMLIAGQMATSLENALLADSIERRVAQRTQHLDADNARLAQLSRTDALTGLANRRQFDAELARHVAQATTRGTSLALAMIDVDHFKLFNDRHGHQAGDECLVAVAAMLRQGARDSDLVARYGGEEFVVILPGTDLDAALRAAERTRTLAMAKAIAHADSPHGVVTLSIGVAALIPAAPEDGARLLRLADAALYEAKGNGRNRVMAAREADLLPAPA